MAPLVCVALWGYAEKESTVGIECDKWVCVSKRKAGPKITFYTWDFAGQVIFKHTDVVSHEHVLAKFSST